MEFLITNLSADAVFSEIYETLGNVPAFILDLYPAGPVLCVVCSHHVAEQITKISRAFPYSLPKAPTTRAFEDLLGPSSIVIAEVFGLSLKIKWVLGNRALILNGIGRGMEVPSSTIQSWILFSTIGPPLALYRQNDTEIRRHSQ